MYTDQKTVTRPITCGRGSAPFESPTQRPCNHSIYARTADISDENAAALSSLSQAQGLG